MTDLQPVQIEIKWGNTTQHLHFVNEESGAVVTLLGVLRGEIAIFLPGILCILVLWGSESVMVLWGITGELCVRTRPTNTPHMI